jgi:hypothetical protein
MSDEFHEIEVEIRATTDRGVLVSDGVKEVWLPIGEIETRPADKPGLHIVNLPDWLAEDRGLV